MLVSAKPNESLFTSLGIPGPMRMFRLVNGWIVELFTAQASMILKVEYVDDFMDVHPYSVKRFV